MKVNNIKGVIIMKNNAKYILISCAMEREAQEIICKLNNVKEKNVYGFKFYFGSISNKEIIVGISGIGLISTSSMISIAIINYDISMIINYGLAGGYGKNIHKNDIVIGEECININSYITGKLKSGIDINLYNFITFIDNGEDKLIIHKASKEMLDIARHIKVSTIFGRIGSGDVWNREQEKIKLLQDKYKVICEEMESIAVYEIAEKYNIPHISIKGISNNEILEESYDDTVLKDLVEYVILFIEEIK